MKNNISILSHCYGCAVCTAICPKQIIKFSLTSNGFYQPQIVDNESCINCGLCIKVCSFLKKNDLFPKPIKAYATWSKDDTIRKQASSGGTGFEIARSLLSKGYKVIGVRYNAVKKQAEHFVATSETELIHTTGSKYIQSNPEKAFKEIKKGNKYLITGTPCQIASMRNYIQLKKIEHDVILIDFFCHGIPSLLILQKYLAELNPIIGETVSISWRDKQTGWHDSWVMKINGNKNGKQTHYNKRRSQGDLFYKFFLGDFCFNKACYKECKFKYLSSSADIRIGDLWGAKYENNEKGVTGVLTFTHKGEETLKQCNIKLIPESVEIVTENQLKKSFKKPFYYNFIMFLLKTSLKLKTIYRISQLLRIKTILMYKLSIKK